MSAKILTVVVLYAAATVSSAAELAGGISISSNSAAEQFRELLEFADVEFEIQSNNGVDYLYWHQDSTDLVSKLRRVFFDGSARSKAVVSEILGRTDDYINYLSQAVENGDPKAMNRPGFPGGHLV